MEDIGNIVVLVFFLLVGLISSLAKAFSDHMARAREKEAARKAAERIRMAREAAGGSGAGPIAVFTPMRDTVAAQDEKRDPEDAPERAPEPLFFDEEPEDEEPGRIAGDGGEQARPLATAGIISPMGRPRVLSRLEAEDSARFQEGPPAVPAAVSRTRVFGSRFRIRGLDRDSLREAFVLSEVLAPPLALRPGNEARFPVGEGGPQRFIGPR